MSRLILRLFISLMPIENPAETEIASEPHRRYRDDVLQLGPKKKAYIVITRPAPYNLILAASCISDPLIGHGRHFGRTVHALCNIQALLTNGVLRLSEQANEPEESPTSEYIWSTNLILLGS